MVAMEGVTDTDTVTVIDRAIAMVLVTETGPDVDGRPVKLDRAAGMGLGGAMD